MPPSSGPSFPSRLEKLACGRFSDYSSVTAGKRRDFCRLSLSIPDELADENFYREREQQHARHDHLGDYEIHCTHLLSTNARSVGRGRRR